MNITLQAADWRGPVASAADRRTAVSDETSRP